MNEGKLYLCATPIGNLEDISLRVLRILKEADVIAAEDTRNSLHLLQHFDIHTPLTSYHEYNKYDKANALIAQMREGKTVALITDAGTPGISDPGEVLVRFCQEEGIEVTACPGPAACITGLILSGLSTRRFAFEGFLPHDKKEREAVLQELVGETRTIVLYEAPHHLRQTLQLLHETLGDRRITLCRELTKKFETVTPTTLEKAVARYESEEPRGEYVLVLEGISREAIEESAREKWLEMSIFDHVQYYTKQGTDKKEAMKKVAADRGISKRDVYQALLEEES